MRELGRERGIARGTLLLENPAVLPKPSLLRRPVVSKWRLTCRCVTSLAVRRPCERAPPRASIRPGDPSAEVVLIWLISDAPR